MLVSVADQVVWVPHMLTVKGTQDDQGMKGRKTTPQKVS